jgi:hypothetical protein
MFDQLLRQAGIGANTGVASATPTDAALANAGAKGGPFESIYGAIERGGGFGAISDYFNPRTPYNPYAGTQEGYNATQPILGSYGSVPIQPGPMTIPNQQYSF